MQMSKKHTPRDFVIAFSYQFKWWRLGYRPSELLATLEEIASSLQERADAAQLPWRFMVQSEVSSLGGQLSEQIVELYTRADVAIFEISTRNPNVFFEMGLVRGRGLKPVLLECDYFAKKKFPSDLQGIVYREYRRASDFRVDIEEAVWGAVESLFRHPAGPRETLRYRSMWSGPESSSGPQRILTGQVPEDVLQNVRAARRAGLQSTLDPTDEHSDRAALNACTRILSGLYPESRVKAELCGEGAGLPAALDHARIIALGGPDFNEFFRRIESGLPGKFKTETDPNDTVLEWPSEGQLEPSTYAGNETGDSSIDYGLFVRYERPPGWCDGASRVLAMAGITSLGTLGAATVFDPYASDSAKHVRDALSRNLYDKNFGIVVETKYDLGTLGARPLWETLQLLE